MNKFNTIQSWIIIMKKATFWRILKMRENTGEEFKMQNSYEFSPCGREAALVIDMRETPRDAGDLVGLQ